MSSRNSEEGGYLKNYRLEDYKRPSVAVDTAVFALTEKESGNYRKAPEKELSLLLVKRAEHPYKDSWVLPGGFLREKETLEEAAARELTEETGVSDANLRNFKVYSEPGRDPRGWIISNAYLALTDKADRNLRASRDAKEAAWFSVGLRVDREDKKIRPSGYEVLRNCILTLRGNGEQIGAKLCETVRYTGNRRTVFFEIRECSGLGFDHAKIIAELIAYLREQLLHTNIGFELLGEEFTLSELQKAYELILGQELLTANFRRKISPLVKETEKLSEGAGHRPARLYRRNFSSLYEWESQNEGIVVRERE